MKSGGGIGNFLKLANNADIASETNYYMSHYWKFLRFSVEEIALRKAIKPYNMMSESIKLEDASWYSVPIVRQVDRAN